jgi:FtsP/CotA-like multicopper oxidase with cupredoxin domain
VTNEGTTRRAFWPETEVCRRPVSGDQCPAGAGTVADYGGVRLALQQGDTLKIRLTNRLPKIDPAKLTHAADPGGDNLYLNPTNLHTHGLLVEARAPISSDPSVGDYIFVSVFNSANGGLFWFHPHAHGIALNQVSSGLAGIITIGNVSDYARGNTAQAPLPDAQIRHLILKDIQVLAAGTGKFENTVWLWWPMARCSINRILSSAHRSLPAHRRHGTAHARASATVTVEATITQAAAGTSPSTASHIQPSG